MLSGVTNVDDYEDWGNTYLLYNPTGGGEEQGEKTKSQCTPIKTDDPTVFTFVFYPEIYATGNGTGSGWGTGYGSGKDIVAD